MILQPAGFDLNKKKPELILVSLLGLTIGLSGLWRNFTIAWFAFDLAVLILFLWLLLFHKKYLLLATAFLIPFSVPFSVGGAVVSFPSEFICFCMTAFFVLTSVREARPDTRLLKHPLTIILLVDLAWQVVTSLMSTMPDVSLKRTFIRINYVVVYYFLMSALFRDPHNVVRVFFLYAAGMIVPVISTFIEHAQFNFQVGGSYEMTRPFFNDHTIYGACIAFILPFLLIFLAFRKDLSIQKRTAVFIIPLLLLLLVAEFFSYSRAAWLSLLFVFVFFLMLRMKIKFRTLLLLALFAGSLLYGFRERIMGSIKQNDFRSSAVNVKEHVQSVTNISTDVSNTERINRWNSAIRMFLDKPFWGFGPGTYQFQYGSYQVRSEMTRISTYSGNRGHAHSEYLNSLSETGFIGFAGYCLIALIAVSRALKIIYTSRSRRDRILVTAILLGLMTYVFHGFFNAFLDIDKMAMLFFSSLAAITAFDLQSRKDETA